MSEDIGVLRGRVQIDIDATVANLRKLHRAMRVASNEIGKSTSKVVAASRSLDKHATSTQRVTKAKGAATKQTALWQTQMQNLTKSVQLALGPLSGVAARITALTALFNRNTIILAGIIGGITGLSVASGKAISAGRAFEQQMMKIDGILEVMGPRARFTAEEINNMAVALGESTLASASGMRDAAASLLQFRNISRDTFQPILEAAQGLTATIGGNLIRNVRRLGRAFEDPSENLESLERSGISFTQSQEDMIEVMLNTGRVSEANAVVLGEMETQIAAATTEAGGLSGAIDTLGERVNRFFENAATGSGLISNLTVSINKASEAMNELLNNGSSAQAFGDTLAVAIDGAVAVFDLLINNIQAISVTLTAVFAGAVAKTIMSGIVGMTRGIGALAVSMNVLNASTLAAIKSFRILGVLSRTIPIVAAAGAIYMTVSALSDYAEGSDDAAVQTRNLANSLNSVETGFDNVGTAAKRAAKQELDDLADTLDALQEHRASLQDAIENEDWRITTQRGAMPGPDMTGEDRRRLDELRSAALQVEKEIFRVMETVRNVGQDVQISSEVEEELGRMPEFFKEMQKEFQPHLTAMREWRVQLDSAQQGLEKLETTDFAEETLDHLEELGISTQAYRDLIISIQNAEPEPKGLDKANDNFDKLTDSIAEARAELAGTSEEFSQEQEASKLTKELNKHPEAVRMHAQELGILNAENMEHSNLVDSVEARYLELIKTRDSLSRTQAFEQMNTDLDRQIEALRGGNDALQEYNDLTEIASSLGIRFSEVTDAEANSLLDKYEALRKIEQQNTFDDLTDDLSRQILATRQGEDALERYTAQMELAKEQGIEFSEVNRGQLDIFIAQRESLEDVEEQAARMAEAYDGAGKAIGSSLDEILGQSVRLGQSLSDTFEEATGEALTFGNVLEDVGRKLADVILQTQVIDPLEQGVTDFVRNYFQGGGGSGFVDDGTRATTGHTGGIVGNLPEYHSGGIVGGIKSNEEVSVLEKGEGVFTQDQMAAMGAGSNVEIIFIDQRSNSDPAPEVQRGTGPDGRRQIKIWLKDAIRESSEDGTMDAGLNSRYGIRPETSRRRN